METAGMGRFRRGFSARPTLNLMEPPWDGPCLNIVLLSPTEVSWLRALALGGANKAEMDLERHFGLGTHLLLPWLSLWARPVLLPAISPKFQRV